VPPCGNVSSEVSAPSGRQIITAPNGVPLLRTPTLAANGILHGFTTRQGGESPPPFATLNLGRGVGDHPDRVAANRRRALEAVGCDPAGHVEAAQVHGRTVMVVGRGQRGAKIDGADALLTAEPGVTLAIHTADCVPILLWDPRRGAIGAVHAGWRGTAVGVAAAAVEEMTRSFETDPADLRVAMGPAVGPCHYEVDTPVAQAFGSWPWAAAVLRPRPGRPAHWSLDLVAANRLVLMVLGVPGEHIWTSGLCTACEADLFFSYRRDGVTGRMGAMIALA